MAFGLKSPAGVYRQGTADTCHFSLDKLVGPESLGKAEIFIADQFNSREEIVNFGAGGNQRGTACLDGEGDRVLVVTGQPGVGARPNTAGKCRSTRR